MALSSYTYKVEEVVVRYQNGHAVDIIYPLHLSDLRSAPPKPINRGGRPSAENNVRYVLRRTLEHYLFFFGQPKPDPVPVTRYGLTKLAVKWCDQERKHIDSLSTPEWDKELCFARLNVSRDTIDEFLKPYFKKKGNRLSPEALRNMLPDLWYI